MSVLDEILAWADSLGDSWLRDALRRIVTQPEISDADIEGLAELCKKPHGLSGASMVPSVSLASGHLPAGQQSGPVYLASLTHVSDVNALAPNETVTFGKTGLSIIYGNNGAGKSGYSRILKRACRARGSGEPVLANALSDLPAGTPTAKVAVGAGGVETEHVWNDGTAAAADLGAVSVFDSQAAQVYISDKTEVRFRPFGLDVLDKLAGICTRVKGRLDDEKTRLQQQTVAWPPIARDTEAGQLLANLTALTKVSEVERLAMLTAPEREELAALEDVLAASRLEDPTKKAGDLRLKATRMRRLIAEMRTLAEQYGVQGLGRIASLRQDSDAAEKLAEDIARDFSSEALLGGLESPAWRAMWEASRAYSTGHAYPGLPFPHVAPDAKCVLCQQAMDAGARARLAKLEEFVRGKAQATAAAKRRTADEALKAYSSLVPGERTRDAIEDLAGIDPTASAAASAFLDEARASRLSIVGGQPAQPAQAVAPIEALEKHASGLETRASGMESAADPVKRAESERRLSELKARDTLSGLRGQVITEIERKGRINAYEKCVRDTSTHAATKLSADLTKKHVTDALTKSFADELKKLGFTTLALELRTAGAQKGVQYHQVQFKYTTRADISKIVSEGEGRCVALAAFLAEVRCAAHASSIVFDDPVSSLDHRWRQNVARRLVEEAKTRQVIVFTHELVFLSALLKEAEKQGVEHVTQTVRRGPDMLAGHVEQELPWDGLPTKKRIGIVRSMWQKVEQAHRTQTEGEYNDAAARLYGRLRQTWERALEEVLLGDVVQRFRQSIETQRLKGLDDITPADLNTVKDGMDKSSKWEGGHDHALAVNEPFPPPDEIKADIDVLEQWVAAVRKRRQ